MGFVGGLLGTAGGAAGSGFAGPGQANIQTPTTTKQAQDQYAATQAALQQQQAFANATQPGGLAALQSQQQLLGDLQNQANGVGPNPALAQLNQTTGQNVANQAALMAGQRGAGQNAGLIARQAAQQGAATQQNAVGQAATLGAQQQLAARQQLAAQQQAMVGQQAGATGAYTNARTNEQSNILNAINAQNSAQVGAQSSVNAANAALAGIQMQGQQNMLGNMMPSAGSVMQMFADGGDVSGDIEPGPGVSSGSTPNSPSVSIPQVKSQSSGGGGGAGGLLALLAGGGGIQPMQDLGSSQAAIGPQSYAGQYFAGTSPNRGVDAGSNLSIAGVSIPTIKDYFSGNKSTQTPSTDGGTATNRSDDATQEDYLAADKMLGSNNEYELSASNNDEEMPDMRKSQDMEASQDFPVTAARGGKVPAMVSPGEKYLSPRDVKKVERGANPMEVGEKIPGKPRVKGAKNSYANDTVPKTLEEGGIVLPRSVTQAKHPHWAAHKFVSAIMAKNGKMPPKKSK